MNEIIERVEKAIEDEAAKWGWAPDKYAHAAIAAMREPTTKMLGAACNEIFRQYDSHPKWDEAKDMIEGLDVEAILQVAIASALEDETKVLE